MPEYKMFIFPPGVFNVITDQNDLGPLMTAHPDIVEIGVEGVLEYTQIHVLNVV